MISLSLLQLRGAVALGGGVAATVLAWGIASAPSRPAGRLGIRGLKRQRAMQTPFAAIEPLVRWLGARLSGVLPEGLWQWIDRQIVLAGDYLGLTPEEYVACSILGSILGAVTGATYVAGDGAGAAAAFLVFAGAMGTYVQVGRVADGRARDISRGLPYVIDLLALAMSAGLDFPGGVRQIVMRSSDRADALNEELERILQELSLGHTRKDALLSFAERTAIVPVREFVNAVVQAEQRGNPLAETLTIQAQVSRQRRSMRAEEAAERSATLIYAPLALLMVSILLLVGGPLVLKILKTLH